LVVRYHRARGVQRQQLRWVGFAAVLAIGVAAVALPAVVASRTSTQVVDLTIGVCVALLPLAIGAAILRYRLYDLDRIIRRTITYGSLTVLLGAGYDGWLGVPRRVLDLGCGLGTELGHLANHGVALTVGVDRSIAALVALFASASQAGDAGLGAVARWREKHVHQR
jgi:hypothetical protein